MSYNRIYFNKGWWQSAYVIV